MQVINARVIVCLGMAQLISWGVTYYLMGALGNFILSDLGWDTRIIFGGFSIALVTMGLCSSAAGRFVDRHGRASLIVGGAINCVSCFALAAAHSPAVYLIAWVPLGIGMRLSLYDAAFATLARTGDAAAGRAIAQITLFGGLASTVFWPVGYFLANAFGWRAAVGVYAVMALVTIPFVMAVPRQVAASAKQEEHKPPPAALGRDVWLAGVLYASTMTLQSFMLAGLTSHILVILGTIGVGAATAVSAAALQGIGQFIARFGQVFMIRGSNPPRLAVLASGLLVLAFVFAFAGRGHAVAAYAFTLLYGAGNGLMTIAKGTLPLVIFDRESYGTMVGRLIAPGFFLAAAAPTVYAVINERIADSAFMLSAGLAAVTFGVTLALYAHLRARERGN